MYHRVRIKKLPKAKTGQQVNGSLSVQSAAMGGADIDQYIGKPKTQVTDSLTRVPRSKANLEAEGGETAYGDINGDGFTEHYKIKGPRHSEGGVPLDLPDGTFIFSDTRSMKIKDCEIIKMFNKSCKKSYTPAELASSININHYRKLLQDPDTDGMTRKTAEIMIRNYNMKLGALALAQESLKGFPQGIPEVSIPYMKAMGIKPEDILPQDPQQMMAQQAPQGNAMPMPPQQMPSGAPVAMSPEMMQQAQMQMPPQEMMAYGGYPMAMYGMEMGGYEMPFAAYGMSMGANPSNYMGRANEYAYGGQLPKAQNGYNFPTTTDAFGNPVLVTDDGQLQGVETIQRSRPGQGYGKQVQDIDKFMEVHAWYFGGMSESEKEKFKKAATSGRKSQLITDFQTSYNKLLKDEAKKKGLSTTETDEIINEVGFSNKGVQKLDGKFGAFTSSRPYFNFEEPEETTTTTTTTTPEKTETETEEITPDFPQPQFIEPGVEWSTGSRRQMDYLLKGKYSREKQYPWAAPLVPEYAEPTYMDPRAMINAQNALARAQIDAGMQFTGPNAGARMASTMGNLAGQAAKTIADVYNYNVGIQNKFEPMNAQVYNSTQKYNKELARNLFDLTNLMKDQYRKEGLAYDQNIVDVANAADTAVSNIEKLNALNPYYGIYGADRDLIFKGGKRPTPTKSTDVFALADRLRTDYGLEGNEAIKEARLLQGIYSGNNSGMDLDAALAQYQNAKKGGAVFAYTTLPFIM